MTFHIGDRIARNDKPEEVYTVAHTTKGVMGTPLVKLKEIMGVFNADGFHAVMCQQPKTKKLRKRQKGATEIICPPSVVDPNDKMFDADENEANAAEHDWIMRQRIREQLKKELSKETQQAANELWDGKHLENAIDQTTSGAQHPQAMWAMR